MSIELPEHLRTGPLAEAAKQSLKDAQSMASASNSVPRISLKGREFHLMVDGEEVAKFRDYLDVVVIGVEPDAGRMIKTFYAGGYQAGAKEPPTCASDDGIAPSPWVQNKQAQTCQTCPKNQFGSAKGPSGKATKACRDSKRAWVKIAPGNMKVMPPGQQPQEFDGGRIPFKDRTLFGINITVASLKNWSEHGKRLLALGQGPAVCVTRLLMQEGDYPYLDFSIAAWLDATDAPLSLAMSQERPWKLMANAGLALAGPAEGGRTGIPTALPGVPAHLQNAQVGGSPAEVVDAATTAGGATGVTKPVDPGQVNDAVEKW
jgi:hypothetical protein